MFNEAKFPRLIFKIGKGVIGRWKIIPEVLVLILHDSYEFDSRDSYIFIYLLYTSIGIDGLKRSLNYSKARNKLV